MSERRREPRKSVDLQVTFRVTESPNATWRNSSHVANLSRYGLFVQTGTLLSVGTTVSLRIVLPSVGPVEAVAEVRWISEDPETTGMGLQFYGETPAALLAYLESL